MIYGEYKFRIMQDPKDTLFVFDTKPEHLFQFNFSHTYKKGRSRQINFVPVVEGDYVTLVSPDFRDKKIPLKWLSEHPGTPVVVRMTGQTSSPITNVSTYGNISKVTARV